MMVKLKLIKFHRCGDATCCQPWRTNWMDIFPKRFPPPPRMIKRTPTGPCVPRPSPEPNRNANWMSLAENLALSLPVPGLRP